MKIIPLGERVLIKPLEPEEKTKSGLYLPKSTTERKEGIVVEVGKDKNTNTLQINQGDRIIYGGYGSEEIELNNEKYLIVEFKDIIARIEP